MKWNKLPSETRNTLKEYYKDACWCIWAQRERLERLCDSEQASPLFNVLKEAHDKLEDVHSTLALLDEPDELKRINPEFTSEVMEIAVDAILAERERINEDAQAKEPLTFARRIMEDLRYHLEVVQDTFDELMGEIDEIEKSAPKSKSKSKPSKDQEAIIND